MMFVVRRLSAVDLPTAGHGLNFSRTARSLKSNFMVEGLWSP
jgi:hypothetical protein